MASKEKECNMCLKSVKERCHFPSKRLLPFCNRRNLRDDLVRPLCHIHLVYSALLHTRQKRKRRPRGGKWFSQHHTESNSYLCGSQTTPTCSSLEQGIVSPFLCIRNQAQPSWLLGCRVTSPDCNQSVSQGWGLLWNLTQGRAPFPTSFVWLLAKFRSLGLLDWRLQFLSGCWLETSPSPLSHQKGLMDVWFVSSKPGR